MHVGKLIAVGAAASLLGGACGGESRREARVATERAGIAAAESTVAQVTTASAAPRTGRWTDVLLLERLVRAGVAPRVVEPAPKGPDWMGVPAIVIAAGGGEVYAWIYADSTARRRVTDALDPATAAPAGRTPPFAAPMVFVRNNNLAAVVTGGSGTNQERIALALEAGLPADGTPAVRPQ